MSDEPTTGDEPTKGTILGKITEKLGWLTADRTMEAKGKLKQVDAADLDSDTSLATDTSGADAEDEAAAEAVDQAELDVRKDYGDVAPGVGNDGTG